MWLLNHGKLAEAKKSLMILRATKNPEDVQQEIENMSKQIRHSGRKPSTKNAILSLKKPEAYKPLLLMNGFFLFQQLTGIFVVIFYAVSIILLYSNFKLLDHTLTFIFKDI